MNVGDSQYHAERTLGPADNKQVLAFPFEVPPGAGRLEITLRYAPEKVGGVENLLVPALFDPLRCRGTGHRGGALKRVVVGEGAATPGFLAGPLTPGRWTLEIEVHAVLPGDPCRMSLEIVTTPAAAVAAAPAPSVPSQPPADGSAPAAVGSAEAAGQAGWYRGDLHTHSVHSDGEGDVAGRIRAAADKGLDFFFLTDHNTVSGLVELATLGARCAGRPPLGLGGLELTTFYGHALCLGARDWIDWRVRPGDGGMPAIVRAVQEAAQLFVIAHPFSVDDPYCTGCAWHYDQVMPGPARAVEVWNGPWAGNSGNANGLALWYGWLNRGERVVATAGTDAHGAYGGRQELPFSVVYASGLNEAALLKGILGGHLYLSRAPSLVLSARSLAPWREQRAMIGDTLALPAGEAAEFACRWERCPAGSRLRIIVDGRLRSEQEVAEGGLLDWRLQAGRDHWCLAELRDPGGDMLALTNPIYLQIAA